MTAQRPEAEGRVGWRSAGGLSSRGTGSSVYFTQGRMGGLLGGLAPLALPAEASVMVLHLRGCPQALRTGSPEDAWARVFFPPDGGQARSEWGSKGGPSCSPLCLGGGRTPSWTLAL